MMISFECRRDDDRCHPSRGSVGLFGLQPGLDLPGLRLDGALEMFLDQACLASARPLRNRAPGYTMLVAWEVINATG